MKREKSYRMNLKKHTQLKPTFKNQNNKSPTAW